MSATVSCTAAYSSRFGAFAGVPVAIFGILFFAFVLGLIAWSARSAVTRENLAGLRVRVVDDGSRRRVVSRRTRRISSSVWCAWLCLSTYVAVIGLFLTSGASTRYPMTKLPGRFAKDPGRPDGRCAVCGRGRGRIRGVSRTTRDGRRGRAGDRSRRRTQQAAIPGAERRAASAARTVPRGAAARAGDGAERRRRGGDRQVQRLPVPGVRSDLSRLQAGAREVDQAGAGQGEVHHQGLPARARSAISSSRRICISARAKPRWR